MGQRQDSGKRATGPNYARARPGATHAWQPEACHGVITVRPLSRRQASTVLRYSAKLGPGDCRPPVTVPFPAPQDRVHPVHSVADGGGQPAGSRCRWRGPGGPLSLSMAASRLCLALAPGFSPNLAFFASIASIFNVAFQGLRSDE